jgi:2-polyprenyl-3-methyl-5-hydroxy-6-metoxy-1,4-benzoquinol methylase
MSTPEPSTTTANIDPLAPGDKPHDAFSFEQLASSYNFQMTSGWKRLFARVLRDECQRLDRPRRVLDIGCGVGLGRQTQLTAALREEIDEFWGIEPDDSITPEAGMFDNFQHALLEDADLPENYFDLSYSFMVVEHVEHPNEFMRAVARSLKPGGVHVFVTVNGAHYFAKIAKCAKVLKIDELILRLSRKSDEIEEYHYPVQYRLNKPRSIDRAARECGFEQPEYVFLEEQGPMQYFTGPFRPAYHLLNYKRKVMQNPRSLVTLVSRLRKAPA